ncbi:MAG: sensor histidine kinase [Actinomycetota bacterium]
MIRFLRLLWAEPGADERPAPYWPDWLLLGVMTVAALLEGTLRTDLVWPVPSIILGLVVMATLPWRRQYPLALLLGVLAAVNAVEISSLLAGVEWEGLYSVAVLLLLPYALARWAPGWHVEVGVAAMALHYVAVLFYTPAPIGDAIGGVIVFYLPVVLGVTVRYQQNAQARRIGSIKHQERELLARELHDTVAHHVSAIAIQAQAGRAVGPDRPDLALDALGVIEEEASRTLAEMRAMIGALRNDNEEAELAPQRGVADIERLAAATGGAAPIEVALTGRLDDLRPTVDAALYRMAQESITNAVRHAKRATRIAVAVHGDDDCVRLTVSDDGDPATFAGTAPTGYGLVGMAERAALLGGTVRTGPRPDRGWSVDAVLPRQGAAS